MNKFSPPHHPKRANIWRKICSDFRNVFPHTGVFFTKVMKANIVAFIKTKILSVKNIPLKNDSPYGIVHCLMSVNLNLFLFLRID